MTHESLTQSVDDDQVHVMQISAIHVNGHEASGLAGLGSKLELDVNIHIVARSRTSMYMHLLGTRVSVHEHESPASL